MTGRQRWALRALFQAEIADEQRHAQFLADKVASVGGEPTTVSRAVEYADHPREMLEQGLAAETQAIGDYDERSRQADVFGDIGLKVILENQIADETRQKEEIERVLAAGTSAEIVLPSPPDRGAYAVGSVPRDGRALAT